MKGRITSATVLLLVITFVCGGTAIECKKPGGKQRVVLKVEKMTCGGCVRAVTHALKSTRGVISAKVTLKPPRAVVVFDSGKTGVKKLVRATTEIGYPSSVHKAPQPR